MMDVASAAIFPWLTSFPRWGTSVAPPQSSYCSGDRLLSAQQPIYDCQEKINGANWLEAIVP